jgi:hypothetical protein
MLYVRDGVDSEVTIVSDVEQFGEHDPGENELLE